MGETCSICQDDCCPDCGDGILDSTEQCDDGNNTDSDGCSAGCIDEDGTATCGNSIWEAGEGCEDGNTTAGDGCSDTCQVEYVCGDGTCEDTFGETCQICPADCCPACGNGVLETTLGEVCDTNQLGGETCEAYCYSGGTPTCTAWCDLDFSSCTGTLPVCGNQTSECGEDCDGSDWGGNTCESLGHDGGTLGCSSACEWDLSNCGPPILSCAAILNAAPGTPSGVFTIDADTTGPEPSFDAYCDMTTDGGGWTLIAAFSNSDGVAHWVQASPWWYATTPAGDYTNPATTADAISPAFYTLAAQEFMVMDSVSGTAFRRSIGNCLGDTSMGAMLTALNFVPATSGLNACLKQCDMQGTGTLATTWYSMTASDRARFGCNDSTDTAGMITFHTDTTYYYDTMTQCNEADWGLGSMEYPPWGNTSSSDVGTGGSATPETVYMYVR